MYLFNDIDMEDHRCQSRKEVHLDPKKKEKHNSISVQFMKLSCYLVFGLFLDYFDILI